MLRSPWFNLIFGSHLLTICQHVIHRTGEGECLLWLLAQDICDCRVYPLFVYVVPPHSLPEVSMRSNSPSIPAQLVIRWNVLHAFQYANLWFSLPIQINLIEYRLAIIQMISMHLHKGVPMSWQSCRRCMFEICGDKIVKVWVTTKMRFGLLAINP